MCEGGCQAKFLALRCSASNKGIGEQWNRYGICSIAPQYRVSNQREPGTRSRDLRPGRIFDPDPGGHFKNGRFAHAKVYGVAKPVLGTRRGLNPPLATLLL